MDHQSLVLPWAFPNTVQKSSAVDGPGSFTTAPASLNCCGQRSFGCSLERKLVFFFPTESKSGFHAPGSVSYWEAMSLPGFTMLNTCIFVPVRCKKTSFSFIIYYCCWSCKHWPLFNWVFAVKYRMVYIYNATPDSLILIIQLVELCALWVRWLGLHHLLNKLRSCLCKLSQSGGLIVAATNCSNGRRRTPASLWCRE